MSGCKELTHKAGILPFCNTGLDSTEQNEYTVGMRCLVQGCEASEKMLEKGITVEFIIDGVRGTGRVCEAHTNLVADNGYAPYSSYPFSLVPIPKERT